MTEKEPPLPTQSDHIQNSRDTPEDEINLVELLEILFRKKTIIVVVAFICTLLSILYAKSMVPTYKATIGFLPVDERSLAEYSNLTEAIYPKTDNTLVRPIMKYSESFLSSFFTIIKSYPTQEKVFIEKNFLKRFVDNKPSANMEKMVLGEINKSIQIKQSGNVKINAPNESFNNTIYLEIVGTKPEAMSDFLNSLAETAKNDTINSIKESLQQEISASIKFYSIELGILRSTEKAARSKQISHLSKNLKIAKNLGVVENNLSTPTASTSFEFLFREKQSLPLWYLYGQRGLEQEIAILKSNPLDDQHIKEAAELIFRIETLSKIDLSKVNFEPVIISRISTPPAEVYGLDKIEIIAIGVALGLFLGVLAAFLSNLTAYLGERSKLSPPYTEQL